MSISFDLTGKVALVTGAASGLGLDLANGFAQFGADIAIVDIKEGTDAKEELMNRHGIRAEWYICDVTKVDQIHDVVQQVLADFGKIDILYNNAGVLTYADDGPASLTEEQWDIVLDTNLKGPFFMALEVYRSWMKEHGGKIINAGSNGGIVGSPMTPSYNISKAAVPMLTSVLAQGFAKDGIQVNTVSPGVMEPGMGVTAPKERLAAFAARTPQGRNGNHEDLCGAAIFLASDANTFCEGANIVCDGGITLPLD